ncbi:MAG: DinB family protein [Saprospiraceae bacterium]|nr:DinB family protein [Saprospiraceae bacterium]
METGSHNERLEEIKDLFQDEFGGLTSNQLNWKPGPNTWSIAQNVDHLIVINTTYFPTFEKLLVGTYQPPILGKVRFLVEWMGSAILKSVDPARQKKTKTFPIWEPKIGDIEGDIIHRFIRHQEELKEWIGKLAPILEADTVISSPANTKISYKLSTALDIILAHEKRHFNQAEEVLRLLLKRE